MDEVQSGSIATAPPPPSEVKIRTMRSDLASMAQAGGGSPRFENIKLSRAFTEQQSENNMPGAPRKNKSDIVLIVALIGVLLALAIVGWFLYQKFSVVAPAPQAAQTSAASSSPSQAQSGLITVPTTTPSLNQ